MMNSIAAGGVRIARPSSTCRSPIPLRLSAPAPAIAPDTDDDDAAASAVILFQAPRQTVVNSKPGALSSPSPLSCIILPATIFAVKPFLPITSRSIEVRKLDPHQEPADPAEESGQESVDASHPLLEDSG